MIAHFDILDRCSEASRPFNEDAHGATATAAWVIDGAKGPFDHRLTPGPSDASWYAQTLNELLVAHYQDLPLDPFRSLSEAAERLARVYGEIAREAPPHEQPSACLSLATLDSAMTSLNLFNIGDCRVMIDRAGIVSSFGSSGIEGLERDAIAELSLLRNQVGRAGHPWTELRGMIRRNFETAMNRPGGYWVTHPSLPWLHEVQRKAMPLREIDHVLIASDGFFRLVNVFHAYDESGLVAAACARGLSTLCAELRSREDDDPDCRSYPRLKAKDDATAVLARIRHSAN